MQLSSIQLQKQKKVIQIKNELSDVDFLFLITYSKLKVVDFQNLKKSLKKLQQQHLSIDLKVYKNTLFKRAIANTKWEQISNFLSGSLFAIIGKQSNLSVIKEINRFVNQHKLVTFKTGFFDNQLLDLVHFQELALLPSQEELLARLLGSLQFPLLHLLLSLKAILTKKTELQK